MPLQALASIIAARRRGRGDYDSGCSLPFTTGIRDRAVGAQFYTATPVRSRAPVRGSLKDMKLYV